MGKNSLFLSVLFVSLAFTSALDKQVYTYACMFGAWLDLFSSRFVECWLLISACHSVWERNRARSLAVKTDVVHRNFQRKPFDLHTKIMNFLCHSALKRWLTIWLILEGSCDQKSWHKNKDFTQLIWPLVNTAYLLVTVTNERFSTFFFC